MVSSGHQPRVNAQSPTPSRYPPLVPRGAVRQEVLLLVGVVLVALGIVGAFGWRSIQRQTILDEGGRMQRIYVALSLYEAGWNGEMPNELSSATPYLPNPSDLTSSRDPFASAAGPFPLDAGLPAAKRTASRRVSDAYLFAHRAAGRIRVPAWAQARYDGPLGLIANEWSGTVKPTEAFQAEVSGLVLRVTVEGNLVQVLRDGPKPLGDTDDLFRKKAARK